MAAIVLFDGVCNFCNSSVNFIIARDRKSYFKFTPLQSETGTAILEKFGIDRVETDSIILVENEKAFTYSTAALRVTKKLDGLWPVFFGLVVIPKPVRDFFYRLFARNRYRLFGKKDVCMVPTPEVRERFLT